MSLIYILEIYIYIYGINIFAKYFIYSRIESKKKKKRKIQKCQLRQMLDGRMKQ